MRITISRFCSSHEFGTFGRLYLPEYLFYTIERPWLDNKRNFSCIPPGIYKMKPSYFFRGQYDTYEIADVPDRSLIKFHIMNFATESLGCVGLGLGLGALEGKWCISRSKEAMEQFMSVMADTQDHEVEIKYVY